ncbi:aldo/keto reductase [Sphingomonas sp. PP-CC-3G-468]|uniref:aldo/keto reductase n=1 Tax=Sphingomonas sp. PP-CC-3G-468 TaxID=2135656 RepID=UPI001047068A|nr:aldo/keto reductase [Sphingomonas sp. PP-CC-3G-468]TCM07443.1 aryl-alcohol dehydrogenase-like predicted oxidoreductase [Sphingomonas sp. PP-CC-3G-468]
MLYNRLGQTGLFVSELCLGTMTFGQASGRYAAASGVGQEAVNAILRRALDAGINFIDNANVYANGQSEEIVGQALKTVGVARKDVVLTTKFEHATGAGPNDGGGSRVHIVEALKASLKRLGTDHVDLYQMHGWDPATPVEETLRALEDVVRQGLVRYIGVSNWAAWQVATALGVSDALRASRFQTYQGYYSLVGREIEREVTPMLDAHGMGLIVFSPLAGGFLTGKYRDGADGGRRATIPFPPVDEERGTKVLDALDPIAAAHGTTLEAVAIAWLRQQKAVTSIIMGVKSVEQLEANLKAVDVTLTDEEMKTLNEIGAPAMEYPGWMLAQSAPRAELLATGRLPDAGH